MAAAPVPCIFSEQRVIDYPGQSAEKRGPVPRINKLSAATKRNPIPGGARAKIGRRSGRLAACESLPSGVGEFHGRSRSPARRRCFRRAAWSVLRGCRPVGARADLPAECGGCGERCGLEASFGFRVMWRKTSSSTSAS